MTEWAGRALAAVMCCVTLSHAQTSPPPPEPPKAPVPEQTTPATPQSSAVEPPSTPGDLYRQALHPLDVVRSSMDNWSDAEMGAFLVGVRMAKQACAESAPENYAGDDLYDLARLCSLGQDWNSANTAATRYLDGRAEPYRTQAFALSINALMHLNGAELAVATAHAMIESRPYDAEVAYAIRYLKDALEQAGDPLAIALAKAEHARVVKALESGAALKAVHGDAVIGVGALYESAIELAFWQRYLHDDADAATTMQEIDAALASAAGLSAEDKIRIEAIRTQYALLGKPLPSFKTAPTVTEPPKAKGKAAVAPRSVEIGPDYAATVLVLFPDWCPQCRKMMKTLTEFGTANKTTPIYAYGLMFLDDPAPLDPARDPKQSAHEQNLKDVGGTSTLLVEAQTARTLGILDFPLGIVLDHEGRVRYVGVLPGDAFNSNGYLEKVLRRMAGTKADAPPAE